MVHLVWWSYQTSIETEELGFPIVDKLKLGENLVLLDLLIFLLDMYLRVKRL